MQGRAVKHAIIGFFTTLLIVRGVDTDARDILLKSDTLVPSVILFLLNVTTPMYEEDEELLGSPKLVTWCVVSCLARYIGIR